MSLNLIGEALPVNIVAATNLESIPFGTPTHQIEGTENIPVEVNATTASLSLTTINASAQNSFNVGATNPVLNLTGYNATVVGLPAISNTDVTTSTATLALTANNATLDDQPPIILTTPTPIFYYGFPDSYDMTNDVSDDGQSPVTYALSSTLPPWMSFDTNTGILTYDGTGEVITPGTDDVTQQPALDTIAYAGVGFNSDGSEVSTGTAFNLFSVSRGDWLERGDEADVWIERTVVGDALNWQDPGAGRFQLNTTRTYGVFATVPITPGTINTVTSDVTFDFWSASTGGALLESVTITLTAIAESDVSPGP